MSVKQTNSQTRETVHGQKLKWEAIFYKLTTHNQETTTLVSWVTFVQLFH
jgi:hypothetical protein